MSNLETPRKKPQLSRSLLADHGIFVEDDIPIGQQLEGLPEHVEALKDALLDFDELFQPECKSTLLLKHQIETSHNNHLLYPPPPDRCYLRPENGRRHHMVKAREFITEGGLHDISKLADEFHDLEQRKCDEDKWTYHIRRHVFHEFEESPYRGGDYSRHGYLFDHWSCAFDYLWTGAVNRDLEPEKNHLSRPKPDITFGFTMIEQVPHTSKGFEKEQLATNFHTTVLAKLLNTYHRTSLPKLRERGNAANDLLCFPWAVVEIKRKDDSFAENCYCQAANGSSFALQLFDDLFFQATGQRDHKIPLVVAFTIVGPEYRVWIAYSSPAESKKKCHRLKCIWRHSMATSWGLIALREIVKNMHIWAARVLRPRVSGYITQCRTKLRLEESLANDTFASSSTSLGSADAMLRVDTEDISASAPPTNRPSAQIVARSAPSSTFSSGDWPFPRISHSDRDAQANNSLGPIFQFWPGPTSNVDSTAKETEANKSSSEPSPSRTPERRYLTPTSLLKALPHITPSNKHRTKTTSSTSGGSVTNGSTIQPVLRRSGFENLLATPVTHSSQPLPIRTADTLVNMNSSITTKAPLQGGNIGVQPSMFSSTLSSDDRSTATFHFGAEQPIRPKSSSFVEPPNVWSLAQARTRPRSSSFLDIPSGPPGMIESVHPDSKAQDGGLSSLSKEGGASDEALLETYHYHEYRLSDQDTRWKTAPWPKTLTPCLPCSEHPAEKKDKLSKDVQSDGDVGSPHVPEKHKCRDNLCGQPEPEVIRRWQEQAPMLLKGRETLQLKAAKVRIDSAHGLTLLDMVMKALRYIRLNPWWADDPQPVVNELNQLLMRTGDEILQFVDIRSEEAITLLRSELERVQIMRDQSGEELRMLLRKCFTILDGQSCLEILGIAKIRRERAIFLLRMELERVQRIRDQSEDELRKLLGKCLAILNGDSCFEILGIEQHSDSENMSAEELAEMEEQAVSIMLNAWTGESLEDGYIEGDDGLFEGVNNAVISSVDDEWEDIDDDDEDSSEEGVNNPVISSVDDEWEDIDDDDDTE